MDSEPSVDVASEPAVELEGVSKRYDATVALDSISFAVQEGEFFTLVGPSGCGKTTTLRLIGGFEDPTDGSLRFDGTDVAGVPPEERDVGVVFQNYALFPHMSVGENIAYGLKFAEPPGGVSTAQRVTELLELVDLADMEHRDPEQLSGGQQQRVAMARALAPGPELLLLDEPMSALDAQLRERLRVQIRLIQQELGITTIYVTHDQEEALAISDRVAVMNGGRVEQIGSPKAIYHRPSTRFVAEFVGDNNVFTGEVRALSEHESGRVVTVDLDGMTGHGETTTHAGATDQGETIDHDKTTVEIELHDDWDLSSGDRLVFCVRPEQLVVDRTGNALITTVTSVEFLGETTRVHLDWQGNELLAHTRADLEGEVSVGFDPADAHVVSVDRS